MKRSLRSWLWRVPLDREVDEELAFHIEMRTRELLERGMDAKTAREIVLSRIGDLGQLKRTCEDLGRKREREMRLTQWLEELRGDVTYAFRQMKATPGFTLVAALTLALGIGANSAMFALADATFLRALPFSGPTDRLVMLWERRANGFTSMASPLEFREWSQHNRSFASMATFAGGSRTDPRGRRHARAGRRADGVRDILRCARCAPHYGTHVYDVRTPSAHPRWSWSVKPSGADATVQTRISSGARYVSTANRSP